MPLVPTTDPRSQWFVSCDEMFGNRRGTPYTMEGRRDHERNFLVVAKTHLHPVSVALCPFLPLPGSLYVTEDDYDLLALMTRMDCTQVGPAGDDYQNWIVTCFYSTDIPTRGGPPAFPGTAASAAGSQNNPDLEFPDVSWDNETAQVPVFMDLDDQPMIFSNDQPMDPPPTKEVGYPVLQITRNEYGYNAQKASDWMYKVNDAPFLGYPENCVQCIRISSQQIFRGKLSYFRVTYRLRFSPFTTKFNVITGLPYKDFKTWQAEILDQGFVYIKPERPFFDEQRLQHIADVRAGLKPPREKPKVFPILDNFDIPTQKPRLLNGKGGKQEQNINTGEIVPYFIKRRIYEKRSFADLLVKGVA